jgi:hypothetical protein
MKKIDLGQAIQILANLGVLAGIVFLALEVSQNTNAIRISTVQGLQQTVSDSVGYATATVDHAALFMRGINDYESLSPDEQAWLGLVVRQIFLTLDSYYWAYRNGAMPDELWDREMGLLRLWLNTPAGLSVWNGGGFSEPFTAFVEAEFFD